MMGEQVTPLRARPTASTETQGMTSDHVSGAQQRCHVYEDAGQRNKNLQMCDLCKSHKDIHYISNGFVDLR